MMQVEEMRRIVQQMTAVIKREVSRKNKRLVIRKGRRTSAFQAEKSAPYTRKEDFCSYNFNYPNH